MLNFNHQYSVVCAYPACYEIGQYAYIYNPSDGFIYRAFIPTFSGPSSWERFQAVSSCVFSTFGGTL